MLETDKVQSSVVIGIGATGNQIRTEGQKKFARLITSTKLFNDSNVLVTDSPLQQSDHVRTNNTVSTSRWFVGSSKVTSCDSVQMNCGGHVRQH